MVKRFQGKRWLGLSWNANYLFSYLTFTFLLYLIGLLSLFVITYRISRAIVPRVSCKNRGFDPVPPGTKQNLKIPFFANISRSTGPIWAIFFLFWRAQWELSNKKKMAQIWSLDHEINVKYPPGYYTILWNFSRGVLYIGGVLWPAIYGVTSTEYLFLKIGSEVATSALHRYNVHNVSV